MSGKASERSRAHPGVMVIVVAVIVVIFIAVVIMIITVVTTGICWQVAMDVVFS